MPVRRICIRKKICSFRPQSRPRQFFQYRSCSQLLQQLSKKDVHRPSKKPDKWCNVTDHILSKVGHNLHKDTHNPVGIIKNKIEEYFSERYKDKNGKPSYRYFDSMDPVVTTTQCFDELMITEDHPSRALTDTFYFNQSTLLRTHTSAHETEFMREGHTAFLATGDCYRRDEIDRCHYPIFHQTEGIRIWPKSEVSDAWVVEELKSVLEGLVTHLFGKVDMRWNEDSFPWTNPSLELEIRYEGEWLEVLGCGAMRPEVLARGGFHDHRGLAFGLGLERLAMALFKIPDIRLFWSRDERFRSQFSSGKIVRFQSFSKFPACYKDVSFWVDEGGSFHDNDFSELIRGAAGDLVEKVSLVDSFTHPKTARESRCYRVTYRSFDRSLTNEEIDRVQENVRVAIATLAGVELR
eukprot:377207_1